MSSILSKVGLFTAGGVFSLASLITWSYHDINVRVEDLQKKHGVCVKGTTDILTKNLLFSDDENFITANSTNELIITVNNDGSVAYNMEKDGKLEKLFEFNKSHVNK